MFTKFYFILVITVLCFNVHKADAQPKAIEPKNVYISLAALESRVADIGRDEKVYTETAPKKSPAERWYPIVRLIRDGNIGREDAIDSMYQLTNDLWDYLKSRNVRKYSDDEWVFPLKGYDASAIGGFRGNGYIPGNFDFFDLNSGGHPAQDIFIRDADQNSLDDATGNPVEILSMSGGIVVETRTNWTPDMMDIKGGNIVYVYDNFTNGLFYYAHMKDVAVKVGDLVEPGTVLGTCGRTGKNAYPTRSPTHLHIMYVRSLDGNLVPENIYKDLIRVRSIF